MRASGAPRRAGGAVQGAGPGPGSAGKQAKQSEPAGRRDRQPGVRQAAQTLLASRAGGGTPAGGVPVACPGRKYMWQVWQITTVPNEEIISDQIRSFRCDKIKRMTEACKGPRGSGQPQRGCDLGGKGGGGLQQCVFVCVWGGGCFGQCVCTCRCGCNGRGQGSMSRPQQQHRDLSSIWIDSACGSACVGAEAARSARRQRGEMHCVSHECVCAGARLRPRRPGTAGVLHMHARGGRGKRGRV